MWRRGEGDGGKRTFHRCDGVGVYVVEAGVGSVEAGGGTPGGTAFELTAGSYGCGGGVGGSWGGLVMLCTHVDIDMNKNTKKR